MLSPTLGYKYRQYLNFQMASDEAVSFKVGTRGIDTDSFSLYFELWMNNPRHACAVIAFRAKSRSNWESSDILALSFSPTGELVKVYDKYGTGTESYNDWFESTQDWQLMSEGGDPSKEYKDGTWKVEVKRKYSYNELDADYSVYKPESYMDTSVAVNMYEGLCPSGMTSFAFSNTIVGAYYYKVLQPSATNILTLSALALTFLATYLSF